MITIVGVDAGGTKTRAVSYYKPGGGGDQLEPVGEGAGGPCNIASIPIEQAIASVRQAVGASNVGGSKIDAICAAAAGYSFRMRRTEFEAELRSTFRGARIAVVPDYEAAFRGAFPDACGVIVIAGTGSIAYGSAGPRHRSHRCGGYGFKIDDSGSGYGIGRQALAAVLAASDGSAEPTLLTERLTSIGKFAVDRESLAEGLYGGHIGLDTVAGLSSIVSEAAADGDFVSKAIMAAAGEALARLAAGVCRAVFANAPSVTIAAVGGLWAADGDLKNAFVGALRTTAPAALLTTAETDPAVGAARIAEDLLNMPGSSA